MIAYRLTLLGFTKDIESELTGEDLKQSIVTGFYPLIDVILGPEWTSHGKDIKEILNSVTIEKI